MAAKSFDTRTFHPLQRRTAPCTAITRSSRISTRLTTQPAAPLWMAPHAQPVRRPAAHCAALPPQPLIDLAFYVETMQEDMSGDFTLTISFIISCIMTYWFIRLLFMGFGVVWAFVFQPPKNDPTRWRQ